VKIEWDYAILQRAAEFFQRLKNSWAADAKTWDYMHLDFPKTDGNSWH
jgi:hypothetical protein